MPIWYHSGTRFEKSSFFRKDLKLDVYLYCPGPSLKEVDSCNINIPGAYKVAINTAYPRVKPDLWLGMDRPACYHKDLLFEPFAKIFRGTYHDVPWNSKLLCEYPSTYFADNAKGEPADIPSRLDQECKFVWNFNTFITTLHILIWMGAKRIHLVGCDFGGSYHDGRTLPDYNVKLYAKTVSQLRTIADITKNLGISFISCTPNSPINKFLLYKPLLDCLQATRETAINSVPSAIRVILPANLAERSCWHESVREDEGVVTLVDSNTEWLLPWWYGRFRRWNKQPVLFVDNGMTKSGIQFCQTHGQYHDLRKHGKNAPLIEGWFAKPFAILCSHFRRTLFLDLDCEVQGDLSDLFTMAESHNIALHEDSTWQQTSTFKEKFGNKIAYNSGVVIVKHGHPLIEQWAIAITRDYKKYYGDQDYLTELVPNHKVEPLPTKFNTLRLEQRLSVTPIIIHWTGPEGKEKIRKELRPIDRAFDAPPRAVEIYKRLSGRGPLNGAEVGVFYGRTSTYLLNMIPDLKMLLVDPWLAVPDGHRYKESGDATAKYDQSYLDKACEYVTNSTRFTGDRVKIIRAESLKAVESVPDDSLDFIFIDADHTYEGCKEDINAWWPKVKSGGLVMGHDIDNQPEKDMSTWGVRKALEEFLTPKNLKFTTGADYTWFVQK